MTVGLVQHPVFLEHDNGPGHPERPERLTAIAQAVEKSPARSEFTQLPTRDATRAELELVHGAHYLDWLEETRERELTILDPDTRATNRTMSAAVRAAGSALSAVQASVTGDISRSFVLCRPPGHHAEANRAMGFCLVNNAAVAVAAAISIHGLRSVAVVDWDVHHGNGTDHIFAARSDVLYMSIHQHPHYPGTGTVTEVGRDEGTGFSVNVPLPSGCADSDYALAMDDVIVPILREFAPELIIVSAGFDAHRNDPLSGMLLTAEAYESITRKLVGVAEDTASGRIVHLLEGGYDLAGLAEGVTAVLSVLTSDRPEPAADTDGDPTAPTDHPSPSAVAAVRTVLRRQSRFWPVHDER